MSSDVVEPADFITFIKTEQFGNLRTLVNSSTEMFFKPGPFVSVCRARSISSGAPRRASRSTWSSTTWVSARLFQAGAVVFPGGCRDQLRDVQGRSPVPDENTLRLVNAIADARLVPAKRDQLAEVAGLRRRHCRRPIGRQEFPARPFSAADTRRRRASARRVSRDQCERPEPCEACRRGCSTRSRGSSCSFGKRGCRS